MKRLVERIEKEATHLGGGIVKIDSLINHQLDPGLTLAMGEAFKARFDAAGVGGIDRIVTAEVSGIAPGLAVACAYKVPMVFARKKKPVTMTDRLLSVEAPSHTKGGMVGLHISSEYLRAGERVLLIDDFLASGQTVEALVDLITLSGATLAGIGCVIEKGFEGGRARLSHLGLPVVTLACIHLDGETLSVSSGL